MLKDILKGTPQKCSETLVFVTFSQLTKINLEAQKMEQMLRDELADSVSKTVSDADRQRILELEKSEMELKVEISK